MGIFSGRHARGSLLAAAIAVVPYAASAQQAPPPPQAPPQLPPPGTQLPQTQQPGRDQVTIPTPNPAQGAPTATVQAGNAVNAGPCPAEIVNSTFRTTVRHINFASLTTDPLDPKIVSLLSGVAAPEGEQPLSVVCTLRDQAVERLREAGYVAAVQIPPQELTGGELTLNVVTAQLTQVRVIGDAGRLNATLADRIEQLKKIKPFNEREAQRILLLASDVPGLTKVQLTLRASPTGTVGEVVGDLEVAYEPVVVLANAQNYGSRALGRETGYVSASLFGLTGLADVTTIAASTTGDFKEQLVGQVGHHFQVGGGASFGGSFTYAISRPDLDALKLRSRSMVGTLDLSVPLVRTIGDSLRVGAGIDLIEQRTQVVSDDDALPLNRDRIRVAFLRLDGSTQRAALRAGGVLQETFYLGGSIEARQGLSIFDATKRGQVQDNYTPSRLEGKATATVIRGTLDGRIRLGRAPLVLAATAVGQWSSAPLLNFEEYSIGNLTIGRGYDPGSNSADRVLGGRGEIRVPVPAGRVEFEPFGFYDYIHIWNQDISARGNENDRSLRSYGGGMRIKLPGLLYLEAMYAHPRDKALKINAGPPSDRFLVSLTARFAPKL